jgi:hypothetical protein
MLHDKAAANNLQKSGEAMNLKLGFFRLWIVASIFWISFCAWRSDLPCILGFQIEFGKWWCKSPLAYPFETYLNLAATAFGPPIAAAIIASAVFWIASGFRGSKISS